MCIRACSFLWIEPDLWCFERWLHPPFKAMVPEAELFFHDIDMDSPWQPVDQG